MPHVKVCAAAGGAAFILSLLVGLISGAGLAILLIRALAFAVLFFALFFLIFRLVEQFVPELLNPAGEDMDPEAPGSRVNISLESVPVTGAFPMDASDAVDDISGPPFRDAAAPLDQDKNPGYTESQGPADDLGSFSIGLDDGLVLEDSPEKAPGSQPGPAAPRLILDEGEEILPDIDSLAAPFVSPPGNTGPGRFTIDSPEPGKSPVRAGKKGLEGDFSPKELAQAIQGVLKKDEKG
ncbi:MAG: hypothetical protein LBG84_09025 [Treponema sp.]|nr:hypothetical protein [Treponema sp.]